VSQLLIELPDEVYRRLLSAAASAGQSPEQWAVANLQANLPTPQQTKGRLPRLMRHAGAVDLGHPTGLDNEQIDADLAKEYADPHENAP
jgi:hypothetical protein